MERNHVALLEERILISNGVYTCSLNHVGWAICVVSIYVHTEAFGDACHVTANVTESENTEFLTHQLSTCLAVEHIANCIDHHTENEFGNSVRVLTRRVLCHHIVGCGCCEVDVIETCTGTNHHFQFFCCVQHFCVHLVRTDNHGVHVFHGVKELSLFRVLLQQNEFVSCTFNFFSDAVDSYCCKRLFSCN